MNLAKRSACRAGPKRNQLVCDSSALNTGIKPFTSLGCKIVPHCSESCFLFFVFFSLTTSVPLNKRRFWITPFYLWEKHLPIFYVLLNFVLTRNKKLCMVYSWRPNELSVFNCGLSVLGKCLGTELPNRRPVFRVPREIMTEPAHEHFVLRVGQLSVGGRPRAAQVCVQVREMFWPTILIAIF